GLPHPPHDRGPVGRSLPHRSPRGTPGGRRRVCPGTLGGGDRERRRQRDGTPDPRAALHGREREGGADVRGQRLEDAAGCSAFALFHSTCAVPVPIEGVGFTTRSSSPLTSTMRFWSAPLQFGNVQLSTCR